MINNVIEWTATVIQNFLIVWFISSYCGYKFEGKKRYVCFGIILAADCIFVGILNRFTPYDGVLSLISVFMYIAYCRLCLKKDLYVHIFISCFAMVIIFTVSSVVSGIVSNITDITLLNLYSGFSVWRTVLLAVSLLSQFALYCFILHLNKAYELSGGEWLLFALSMMATWLAVILFNRAAMTAEEIKPYMLLASLIMLAINVLLYYFVLKINKETAANRELRIFKMRYDSICESEKNLARSYESTYALKHDLEKHLIAVKTKAEQSGDGAVADYVTAVLDKYSANAHKTVFANSAVFNAIMNTRLEMCARTGIKASVKAENNALDNVRDEDIAVLFGNIFDNAIAAAEKTDEKIITLDVCVQGAYVSIYMKNSFDGVTDPKSVSEKSNALPTDGHGMGLRIVEKIVKEYNGMMKLFAEDGMFCCDILLENYQT